MREGKSRCSVRSWNIGFFVIAYHGRVKRRKATTCGWDILVEKWKDGSSNWIALKDLKDSYPVERARYTTTQNLDDEAALSWWVPFVLKKKLRILKKVKSSTSIIVLKQGGSSSLFLLLAIGEGEVLQVATVLLPPYWLMKLQRRHWSEESKSYNWCMKTNRNGEMLWWKETATTIAPSLICLRFNNGQ